LKEILLITAVIIGITACSSSKEKIKTKSTDIITPMKLETHSNNSIFNFKEVPKCEDKFSNEQEIKGNYKEVSYISSILKTEDNNGVKEKIIIEKVIDGEKETISICIDNENQIKVKINNLKQKIIN